MKPVKKYLVVEQTEELIEEAAQLTGTLVLPPPPPIGGPERPPPGPKAVCEGPLQLPAVGLQAPAAGQSAPPATTERRAAAAESSKSDELSKAGAKASSTSPAALPASVELLFRLKDGSEKLVQIDSRPLSVGFKVALPFEVAALRSGGTGEKVGIQIGWVLLAVNGEPCEGQKMQELQDKLRRAIEALPLRAASTG